MNLQLASATSVLSHFPDIKLKSVIHYGVDIPNPIFDDSTQLNDWHIWITIRLTKNDNVRTVFQVNPPLWLKHRVKIKYKFKTTSYKELRKWLKKHEGLIFTKQEDWDSSDRIW